MKKKVVLPGEFLSTEEEFSPGRNAFEDEGSVYSGCVGSAETDSKTKEVSVKPAVGLHSLARGSLVLGRVALVKENSVSIELCEGLGEGGRMVISHGVAMLPIRCVSRDYVESLRDCFKVGDIVKVRVSKLIPAGIDVETNQPELGVIKAFCSRCRQPLHLFGASLKCIKCGSSERRKIANDYVVK